MFWLKKVIFEEGDFWFQLTISIQGFFKFSSFISRIFFFLILIEKVDFFVFWNEMKWWEWVEKMFKKTENIWRQFVFISVALSSLDVTSGSFQQLPTASPKANRTAQVVSAFFLLCDLSFSLYTQLAGRLIEVIAYIYVIYVSFYHSDSIQSLNTNWIYESNTD